MVDMDYLQLHLLKKEKLFGEKIQSLKTHQNIHLKKFQKWPKEKQEKFGHYAYQISETHMKGPDPEKTIHPDDDAANYYNHSCDPTTWYDSYQVITARKDIAKDEEITYDYCTSELNETKKIHDCGCGTEFCRKKITKDDWKIESLQERYKGHFLGHVKSMIDNHEKIQKKVDLEKKRDEFLEN